VHFDLKELIQSFGFMGGQLVILGVIFAESGLLIGCFLPGDSLLFTAGFLASQGLLNIWLLIPGAFICEVLGDNVGYATGRKFGRSLFQRKDSRFFHKENLVKAEKFYEKQGKKTIVLARFMPVVRTFAPIVAGVSEMKYGVFLTYNIIGGFIWTFGLTILGYFLGKTIPDVDKYLLPIVISIVILSILPSLIHLYGERKQKK
jgi:membrane-associated protein